MLLVQNDDDGRRNGIVLPVSHPPFSRQHGMGLVLEDGSSILAFEFGLPTDGWSEILQRNIALSCRIYVLCSPHKCTYFFDLLGPLVYFVSCDMSRSAERCCMGTSLQSTTRVSSAASHKPPPPLTTCRQWAHPRPALRPLRTPL